MKETFYRVQARTLWVDYPGFRFVQRLQTGRISYKKKADIDEFISQFAVISKPHTVDNEVHHSPPSIECSVLGERPCDFHRACRLEIDGISLEVKGVGVPNGNKPLDAAYSTGICYFPNTIYEAYVERIARKLFRKVDLLSTQRTLAIIELPFECRLPGGQRRRFPCALLIREPAIRMSSMVSDVEAAAVARKKIFVEQSLRRVGLSSSNPYKCVDLLESDEAIEIRYQDVQNPLLAISKKLPGSQELLRHVPGKFERVNLQFAQCPFSNVTRLVDFEHYSFRNVFNSSYLSFSHDQNHWSVQFMLTSNPSFIFRPKRRVAGASICEYVDPQGRVDRHYLQEYGHRTRLHYRIIDDYLNDKSVRVLPELR